MGTNAIAPVELLNTVFEDVVAETRFSETPALSLLAASARLQAKRDVNWTVKVSDPTVSGRTIAGALSNDTQSSLKKASLVIPDYYLKHQFEVLERDIQEAAEIGEISYIRDLLGMYAVEAMQIMSEKASNLIINGNGTEDATNFGVIGLENVLAQTGTYAGINKVTFPRWKPIVKTGGVAGTAEALTVNRVSELLLARRAAGATYRGGSELVILTDPRIEQITLRTLYEQDANPQGTYNGVLNISDYTNFFVQGIPVLSDYNVQDNSMHFLDLSQIRMVAFDLRGPLSSSKTGFSRFFNYRGLQFRLSEVEVGNHTDKYKFELVTNFQIQVMDPIQAISAIRDVAVA